MSRPTITVPSAVELQRRWGAVIPRLIVGGLYAAGLLGALAVWAWGWQRGIGVGILLVGLALAPRQWRIDKFVSAAFFLANEALHLDQWEAYKRNRWRARLQQFGVERDFSFRPEAVTAAKKSSWVKLKIAPWWAVWPSPEQVTAVRVRIPPGKTIDEVQDALAKKYAFFFQVTPEQLKVTPHARWMRSAITFEPTSTGSPVPAAFTLLDEVQRRNGQ